MNYFCQECGGDLRKLVLRNCKVCGIKRKEWSIETLEFDCENCGLHLDVRVPKHKGRYILICPKCNEKNVIVEVKK